MSPLTRVFRHFSKSLSPSISSHTRRARAGQGNHRPKFLGLLISPANSPDFTDCRRAPSLIQLGGFCMGFRRPRNSKKVSACPSCNRSYTDDDVRLVCRNDVPFRERISCTVAEACVATGLGRTKLYELIKQKRISTIKVGARTLINVGSLVAAFEQPRPNERNASARA